MRKCKNLTLFYCKYCGTEQYLNYKKNRKICGSKECAKERAVEQRANKASNKTSNKTLGNKSKVPILSLDINVLSINEVSSFTPFNAYNIKECLEDAKEEVGYLVLFGDKYLIDEEKTDRKKGYISTEKKGSNWLVFMDKIVRVCSSNLSLKLAIIN